MSKPNILILMVDQLSGCFFDDESAGGPAGFLHCDNLRQLAGQSVRFSNAYTPSPLCSPARASFMSGLLPSRSGVYDNAGYLPSDLPSFAHHLRNAGYYTCLSGKMHFVGPDQLHGFEERLTTDIYPADFGWTPDYDNPDDRIAWWYHNMDSVKNSGVAAISNQLEFDDEVAASAQQCLYRLARTSADQPWCLCASFTHPHDPYVARKEFWDLYDGCAHLQPTIGALDFADHDPHSQRILRANDALDANITQSDIANARRAYFANISYLDHQIGKLLQTLDDTGMRDKTMIMFCADHGDMLGEKGLWYKMSFFEGSARIPLMFSHPDFEPKTYNAPVSLLDVLPTLCEIGCEIGCETGCHTTDTDALDGESLLPLMAGKARTNPVLMEYCAEGSQAPMVSIRSDNWKFIQTRPDPDQLFDLAVDPMEMHNLADLASHAPIVQQFRNRIAQRWDLDRFDREVRQSQRRRHAIYSASRKGTYTPWDFQPHTPAHARFMRNHMDLNEVEANARFPKSQG